MRQHKKHEKKMWDCIEGLAVLHRVSAYQGVDEIRSKLKLSGGGRFSMPRFRSPAVLSLVIRPREGNAVR